VKTAKAAADAGVRISQLARDAARFIDSGNQRQRRDELREGFSRQVHKSTLDDKRLREVAEATGGSSTLENGLRTMQQIKLKA